MKFLLSIRSKFYNNTPEKWIKEWLELDKNNVIDGCEIYVDMKKEEDKEYVKKLAPLFKKNNWVMQFHGPDIDQCFHQDVFSYYREISNLLGYKVKINVHGVSSKVSKTYNQYETYYYFKKLYEEKKDKDLIFTLENLNQLHNPARLSTNDIEHIVDYIPPLGFCWDVGHEVDDEHCYYQLSNSLKEKLTNIHFHDIGPSDHYPFYFNRTDIKKTIQYLEKIHYKKAIVMELALDYLKGESYQGKQMEYIKQIELVKSYKNGEKK